MSRSYVYGVSVIVLAALATVNLIRLRTDSQVRADSAAPLASAPGLSHVASRRVPTVGERGQMLTPGHPSGSRGLAPA